MWKIDGCRWVLIHSTCLLLNEGKSGDHLALLCMCELVECFAMRQKIPFFALANHIVYVIVAKSKWVSTPPSLQLHLATWEKSGLGPHTNTNLPLPLAPSTFSTWNGSLGFGGSHVLTSSSNSGSNTRLWSNTTGFHYKIYCNKIEPVCPLRDMFVCV
jgi:hypothetical protein